MSRGRPRSFATLARSIIAAHPKNPPGWKMRLFACICDGCGRWHPEDVVSHCSHSSVAAIFAEQVKLLLNRTIREAEQHSFVITLVADPLPAWHYEDIARAPLKGLLTDTRTAVPLDRREHGRVCGTIASRLESLWQQLDKGADRRHRKVTSHGIGKT